MLSISESTKIRPELSLILRKVLEKITPKPNEEEKLQKVAEKVCEEVREALNGLPVPFSVEVHGSFAHDTWLSGDRDIDIFILLRECKPKDFLQEILNILEEKLPYQFEHRYAEHPYLKTLIDDVEIEIVPGYYIEDKVLSAVDRTPRHTRFLKQHLTRELCDEVRLLKAFLKGIGAYGAEIKVQGFSGYACELLIIHYRSFLRTLLEIANKPRIFIDFTKTWTEKEAKKTFKKRVIIIDPTDPKRNVTANLSNQTFLKVKIAAKLFLEKPSDTFFFPKEAILPPNELLKHLQERSIILVELEINPDVSPDTYWGQAKRIMDKIQQFIRKQEDVYLYNIDIFEGRKSILILLETNTKKLPLYMRIRGPPVWASGRDLLNFLKKHQKEIGPIITLGPRIAFITRRREDEISVANLLKKFISTIKIKPSFLTVNVYDSPNDILEIVSRENALANFSHFITGKPPWLPEL
ncbi:MAG: CCA tRNA nucleotidyltransferase [Candidatus Njordarchaeales archaeon]